MLRFRAPSALCGALVVALLAALIWGTPVKASIVEALDLAELVAESDRIVIGRVVFAESFQRRSGTIVTVYRFQVERELLSNAPSPDEEPEVLIQVMGGMVGNVGMRVEGEPKFAEGERALLFMEEGRNLAFRPVGMAQGVMRIRMQQGREMVSQSREGLMLVRRGVDGRLQKSPGAISGEERLDVMVDKVRDIVRRRIRDTP